MLPPSLRTTESVVLAGGLSLLWMYPSTPCPLLASSALTCATVPLIVTEVMMVGSTGSVTVVTVAPLAMGLTDKLPSVMVSVNVTLLPSVSATVIPAVFRSNVVCSVALTLDGAVKVGATLT